MLETSYKKQSVKRYVKIDKIRYRKYHIKDLHLIIKLLYPYRQTVNKYEKLLRQLSFNEQQQRLILDTTHSLTIINELYRDQDKYGRFYVTREDMFNAIYMLQNELNLKKHEYLLSASLRWFYNQVVQYFDGRVFTSREVSLKLRKSKSLCYRYLTELVDRNFIRIVGKRSQAYVYKLKEKEAI
jgi:hypothetical protein